MKKLYVDSNIWLDYWLDRTVNITPIGCFAERMLERATDCEFTLIVSDFILKEIESNMKTSAETNMSAFRKIGKLNIIRVDGSTFQNAKELASKRDIPIHDAVHALMAKKIGAILVTRDKHFGELEDIIVSKRPEEL